MIQPACVFSHNPYLLLTLPFLFCLPSSSSHKPVILKKKTQKACVVPRPIGWISTRSPKGKDNLAPYSQFNNLTFDPPYVMFSSNRTPEGKRKDTVINAETTGK
jgi:flavin reductase (DIM6/NTAB) family NADH-FMN oxidoreductase RutF